MLESCHSRLFASLSVFYDDIVQIHNTWEQRGICAIACGIFLLAFAVYVPTVRHSFVLWDDDNLVVENPIVRDVSMRSVWRAFTTYDPELYIPLTFLSYQVDQTIAGGQAWPFHTTNILLHAVNALLVFFVLLRLSNGNIFVASAAGVLFAVHPLHAEAVSWVSARKDLLSAAFFLGSLLAYMRFQKTDSVRWYALALGFFLFALLSKVVVVGLPLILLLLAWRNGERVDRALCRRLAPFFILSVVFLCIAFIGKSVQAGRASPAELLLVGFANIGLTLRHIFVPVDFSVLYPYEGDVSPIQPVFLWSVAIVLAIGFFIVALHKKTPDALFWLGFGLITILPTMLNARRGEADDLYLTSDRYGYLPSVAVFAAVAMVLRFLLEHIPLRVRSAAVMTLVIVPVALGFLARQQSTVWRTTDALFAHVLRLSPGSHTAYHNIAAIEHRHGDFVRAVDYYHASLEIQPLPKTWANLGHALLSLKRPEEALASYNKALALNPRSKEAHLGLGLLAGSSGNHAAALDAYDAALEIDLQYLQAHINRGATLLAMSRTDEAITGYQRALDINPSSHTALFNLGVAFMKTGKTSDAEHAYRQAIRVAPDLIPARINLALLLAVRQQYDEARTVLHEALKIDPQNPQVQQALQRVGGG